jgi:DNA-binding CsgD family transcriptional regulator
LIFFNQLFLKSLRFSFQEHFCIGIASELTLILCVSLNRFKSQIWFTPMLTTKRVNSLIESTLNPGLLFLFLAFHSLAHSQNPYHITSYKKSEYIAANQNWDIDLDAAGNVFIANHKGLISLSGSHISVNELPGKTTIRSVAAINNRIFTGSFEEFGYWEPDESGSLLYTSLVPLLVEDSLINDEIWKIVNVGDQIYFQSFGKLLCYENQRVGSITIPGAMMFLLKCNERLFAQQIDGGLYEIIDKQLHFIEGSHIFSETEIKAMLPLEDGSFIIGTSSRGLVLFDGLAFHQWEIPVSEQLKAFKINNGISIGNRLIFGTILNGVFILSLEGELLYHINTASSLQNNTVLAVHADADNNLWVGLDKGFDYIAFNSPLATYIESGESFGTVYTACLFKNTLYVGTNQGIYYFRMDNDWLLHDKRFLNGSQGQVWFISIIDGALYCGLNDGTYLIHDNELVPVSNVSGGYNLKQAISHKEQFLVQSTYSDLVVYSRQHGTWRQSHTMAGFGAPARFLEVDHTGNIWLGHTIAGLYLVQPNAELDTALLVLKPGIQHGIMDNWNHIFKVDNRVILPTGQTLLQWDAIQNKMVPYDELTLQLEGFEASHTILAAGPGKYWFIKENEVGFFEIRFGKAKLLYRLLPQMYSLNLVEDYENIVALNDSLQLICLENGFSILNLQRLNHLADLNTPPLITEVIFWKTSENKIRYKPDINSKKQFKHSHNNLQFIFSASGPVGKKKYFQYQLHGFDKDWSDWVATSEITYNRLPPGSYTFMLRTLTNQGMITEYSQVELKIRPPWYLSYFSFTFYLLLIVGLVWLIRLNYLRRNWKNQEEMLRKEQEKILLQKEQAESEVIRLSNEKLQSEIMLKNSQLANSTMALLRKNELLGNLQEELNRQREELGQRLPRKYFTRINRLIENSFKSDQEWEVFEKLFDQAHENFFQRLKSDYPCLTPSDLRLCAYLRLNLSSKEIAPLLNISVRGVEERRYRLRKRLKLASERNLTEFILAY